jgi:hypothetical protein
VLRKDIYAPQTKILEGRTNVSERVFEALFKGVSTVFGLQNVEKCFETRVLKSMFLLPKSSFGRGNILKGWFGLPKFSFEEHKVQILRLGVGLTSTPFNTDGKHAL